jgi:signal transduction histidine kinase
MYDLILGLRPSVLDDLGLVAALRSHCQYVLETTDISFEIETEGLNERLPPLTETALFRICQEALTNVLRHAQAQRVDFMIVRQNGIVEASILDDGLGFDQEEIQVGDEKGRGLGLLGMRERAEQFCGNLTVESQPGKGTKVHVSIPVDEVNNV